MCVRCVPESVYVPVETSGRVYVHVSFCVWETRTSVRTRGKGEGGRERESE